MTRITVQNISCRHLCCCMTETGPTQDMDRIERERLCCFPVQRHLPVGKAAAKVFGPLVNRNASNPPTVYPYLMPSWLYMPYHR